MRILDFVVAGFMKCGTTSLHGYLQQHPRLDLPEMKETDYFVQELSPHRDADWYAGLFSDDAEQLRGEVSPNYAKRHCFPGVAQRIHDAAPDISVFFLIRDPIDRAVSHYKHQLAAGHETDSIETALAPSEDNHYLTCSRYAYQLTPYVQCFGSDNIHIYDSHSLRHRRDDVLRSIFDVLGVEPVPVQTPRNEHRSDGKRRPAWLDRQLPGSSLPVRATRFLARKILPDRLTVGKSVRHVSLSDSMREQIADFLRDDVRSLRELTGLSLTHWSV